MLISLVFKKAETFIKLKQGRYCDRNKCQKELYRSYKYDEKILKDTILFVRFMLEYTGEDKVQEKRMAANVFKDLLISKKVKYYYNSELLKLIQDTIKLYINCDLINDLDKDPIKVEKKQKNFFEENKRQIDEIVKVEKKEAEIEQSNKDFATRFKVKEKEPEKKEIIYDRNKILKEKKMQELEIGKEKEKKSTKSYDEDEATKTKETFKKEVIREKEEIKEVKNIRDKYRNKNK